VQRPGLAARLLRSFGPSQQSFACPLELWLGYPGIATIAALTDSLRKAETAFADLAESVTFDDYFEYEISFEVADDSPPKRGTMQARP